MGADATALFATDKNHNDIKESRENVLDFTCGIGFNTIIVATSNLAALDFAAKIAGKNSRINIFAGIPKSSDRSLGSFSLDPNLLHYNQISLPAVSVLHQICYERPPGLPLTMKLTCQKLLPTDILFVISMKPCLLQRGTMG
jgi:hypothetical protein